jgi:hypothetical protein
MSGMFLSDDKSNPKKWRIPTSALIPSKGYIVVWADDSTGGLHAGFKLSQDGEWVGLYGNTGLLIDSVSFGPQSTDVSFGRSGSNLSNWLFFGEPVPGAANFGGAENRTDVCTDAIFSIPGGIYAAKQTIGISTSEQGSSIRYTLDGSIPLSYSPKFTNSVTVDTTTVIRVRVFRDGYLPGPVSTATYIINKSQTLPVISISTNPLNLWDDHYGIYTVGTNGKLTFFGVNANYWQNWEKPCNVEFYVPELQTAGFNIQMGLSIHGERRNMLQKTLSINANDKYGTELLEYRMFNDKPIHFFESLVIRNNGYSDYQKTAIRDGIAQAIVVKQMDIDYQSFRLASVFLNGCYWGMYGCIPIL